MARKPKVTENPLYEYIRFQTSCRVSGIPPWMDDIIMGACYTAVGDNNGKLNVSPSLVRAAVFLPQISTLMCQNIYSLDPISERTARRVAQAARFALGGIEHYLEMKKNEEEQKVMKANWLMEKAFVAAYENGTVSRLYAPPSVPAPREILQLYRDKKFFEYGEALMRFRKKGN